MIPVADDILKIGIGTALALGAIGGTVWYATSKLQEHNQDNAYERAYGGKEKQFPAAQTAIKLQMAFENVGPFGAWGTDEEAVFRALREIPTRKDFNRVETEYAKITKGRSLAQDLQEELEDGWSSGYYQKAQEIINKLP